MHWRSRSATRRKRRARRSARWTGPSPERSNTMPTGGCAASPTALAAVSPVEKWVYDFSEGSREMRELLGGKGANIAEMTRIGGPVRVPAGFTITTAACVAYMRDGDVPDGLGDQVADAL